MGLTGRGGKTGIEEDRTLITEKKKWNNRGATDRIVVFVPTASKNENRGGEVTHHSFGGITFTTPDLIPYLSIFWIKEGKS
jgi:hypothetical protein